MKIFQIVASAFFLHSVQGLVVPETESYNVEILGLEELDTSLTKRAIYLVE
jgi:hypothetical protein